MILAHILDGLVHAVYAEREPWMAAYDVRDVSDVAGIAMGWEARPDGSFAAPSIPAATVAELIAYAEQAHAAVLAAGIEVNVAAAGEPEKPILSDGTNGTRASLGLLALYGQVNPTGTKTWLANDGTVSVLTGTECVALATLVGEWISDTYPVLIGAIEGIRAAPPTISTRAQVDAAFA